MKVGLLQVGHIDPAAQHIAGDYPELFQALLEPVGLEVVTYNIIDDGRWPASLAECNGWLMSPSRLSVYADEAWINDAEDVVRELVAREKPFVGICFGHQLLAQALGGRVEKSPNGWGVGVQQYEVVEQPAWMQPPVETFRLIASHEDQVVDVPMETRVIATSNYCKIAGLAVGERAWSVQAHPEFIPELADHLLAGRIDLVGAERVQQARATLVKPGDRGVLARWIARSVGAATP